jgi:uncharacterized protein (TIGR02466 family)
MFDKTIISFSGHPILKIKTDFVLNKKELFHIENMKYIHHNENPQTLLSAEDLILNHKKLKRAKDMIMKHFKDYVTNILEIEDEFYMSNSWCTLQKKGEHHPYHNHPGSIFSSTFYTQVKEGALIFSVPNSIIQSGFNFDYKIKNYNYYNSLTWQIPITSGDLLIFPAQLSHESKKHDGEEVRIMLGSSYFVKGNLGFKEKYNFLNLK